MNSLQTTQTPQTPPTNATPPAPLTPQSTVATIGQKALQQKPPSRIFRCFRAIRNVFSSIADVIKTIWKEIMEGLWGPSEEPTPPFSNLGLTPQTPDPLDNLQIDLKQKKIKPEEMEGLIKSLQQALTHKETLEFINETDLTSKKIPIPDWKVVLNHLYSVVEIECQLKTHIKMLTESISPQCACQQENTVNEMVQMAVQNFAKKQEELKVVIEGKPFENLFKHVTDNYKTDSMSFFQVSALAKVHKRLYTKQSLPREVDAKLKADRSYRSLLFNAAQNPEVEATLKSIKEGKVELELMGLENLGNTCFIASTVQVLLKDPSFKAAILSPLNRKPNEDPIHFQQRSIVYQALRFFLAASAKGAKSEWRYKAFGLLHYALLASYLNTELTANPGSQLDPDLPLMVLHEALDIHYKMSRKRTGTDPATQQKEEGSTSEEVPVIDIGLEKNGLHAKFKITKASCDAVKEKISGFKSGLKLELKVTAERKAEELEKICALGLIDALDSKRMNATELRAWGEKKAKEAIDLKPCIEALIKKEGQSLGELQKDAEDLLVDTYDYKEKLSSYPKIDNPKIQLHCADLCDNTLLTQHFKECTIQKETLEKWVNESCNNDTGVLAKWKPLLDKQPITIENVYELIDTLEQEIEKETSLDLESILSRWVFCQTHVKDKFRNCTEFDEQLSLSELPVSMTLRLVRFANSSNLTRMDRTKVKLPKDGIVDFKNFFDFAPGSDKKTRYKIVAFSRHVYGNLFGGHFAAYVQPSKNEWVPATIWTARHPDENEWFSLSDASVDVAHKGDLAAVQQAVEGNEGNIYLIQLVREDCIK